MNVRQTALFLSVFACAASVAAQTPQAAPPAQPTRPSSLSLAEVTALAKVEVAISKVRDSLDLQLALARNKKDEVQATLRKKMENDVAAVLHHNGMTDAEYRKKTFVVSTDNAARKLFDSLIVVISGNPLPGIYVAPAAGPMLPVPAGPVGAHIGHVVNSFTNTPSSGGLLPTALGEARVALQHAQLSARQPDNLDYMKTHIGHVLNALDPSIEKVGPGLGYGLRRAAEGVAEHIGLAAAAEGATAAQKLHATHVSNCAKNTVTRVDAMVALAKQVQVATSAADAAALVGQIASLAEQLIAGADGNADGRISVDIGEGGLQLADDHVKLMLGVGIR